MSTFNTFIKVNNFFNSELFNGVSQIANGKLVGKLPITITSGEETSDIQVNAENAEDGSSGSFTYDIVIHNETRQISINFVCNNALRNSVTAGSPTPSIIQVDTSSYSQEDHPLKVTVTLGAAKMRPP